MRVLGDGFLGLFRPLLDEKRGSTLYLVTSDEKTQDGVSVQDAYETSIVISMFVTMG